MKTHLAPLAVRMATLGSWRMLTLGAEYEDTWLVPARKGHLQEEGKVETKETMSKQEVEKEPTSWAPGDARKYDAVLLLNGRRSSSCSSSGGVHHMIRRHEEQNCR